MVGYWLYKFKVEDRDIGVVDYVSLRDAKDIHFPLVAWCLKNPFIEEKLKSKNSSITSTAYRQYLEGKIYDKSYEPGRKILVTIEKREEIQYYIPTLEPYLLIHYKRNISCKIH